MGVARIPHLLAGYTFSWTPYIVREHFPALTLAGRGSSRLLWRRVLGSLQAVHRIFCKSRESLENVALREGVWQGQARIPRRGSAGAAPPPEQRLVHNSGSMPEFKYVGSELDLFAAVHHWKSYWSTEIRRFIKGDVLEVGAGTGSNTPFLDTGHLGHFVCLEPDPQLLDRLGQVRAGTRRYETICGTLETLPAEKQFDTIVYIDVLEHIEDDRAELNRAVAHLRSGGRVIVLSPAHQWLFTPFDAAIGHFRRYGRSMVEAISPPGLELELCRYLDSVGLAASAANLVLLRQSMPTKDQLRFWDTFLVPMSRLIDRLLLYSIGKSILAVWRKSI